MASYQRLPERRLPMFRNTKSLAIISIFEDAYKHCLCSDMRLSWPQHLQASRTVEHAGESQRGMALALMGMSLLILAEDLLESEQATTEAARQA